MAGPLDDIGAALGLPQVACGFLTPAVIPDHIEGHLLSFLQAAHPGLLKR